MKYLYGVLSWIQQMEVNYQHLQLKHEAYCDMYCICVGKINQFLHHYMCIMFYTLCHICIHLPCTAKCGMQNVMCHLTKSFCLS